MPAAVSDWYVPPSPELGNAPVKRGAEMDASLGVSFAMHPVLQHDKTVAEGRPIFEPELYIRIVFPGDRLSMVHRAVRPEDKHRFPQQWHAFETGGHVGTPLEKCPVLTISEVEELKFFRVQTCEELVQMNDGNAQKFAGIRAMQTKVRDFLNVAKGAAETEAVRSEVAKRDAEVSALKAALDEQKAQLAQLMAAMAEKQAANSNQEHQQNQKRR